MKNTKLFPISVVISAYNEEEKIVDCLKSVDWVDEVIVIDNSSTDDTAVIAKRNKAKVFLRPNNFMLNSNKNYGFTKAKNEWIFSLDADERVTSELKNEIISIFSGNNQLPDGFWIPRKNIIFGKWIRYSIWWPDYQLRLFKKIKGKFPEKDVHEMVDLIGDVHKLSGPLVHYNYETVSQYIYKMDKIYTENAVKNIIESGKKLQWYEVIRMPAADFLKTFFLQKGYKDGLHGLLLSMLQAFYAEIVFAKVWEKQGFPEYISNNFVKEFVSEFRRMAREFYYWILTSLIEEERGGIKKLYYQIIRKKLKVKLKNESK